MVYIGNKVVYGYITHKDKSQLYLNENIFLCGEYKQMNKIPKILWRRKKYLNLFLVFSLCDEPGLYALPGLHEGLAFGHLAGVVGQHTS